MKRMILCLPLLLVLNGCFLSSKSSAKRDFPSHLNAQMHGSLNVAKERIDSVGKHKVRKSNIKVTMLPGQRRIKGKWAWREPALNNIWVFGLCSYDGHRIKLGVNPGNQMDYNPGTADHEMAHHWHHGSNLPIYHDPVYDPLFEGWATSRKVQGMSNGDPAYEDKVDPEHESFVDANGVRWVAHVVPQEWLDELDLDSELQNP